MMQVYINGEVWFGNPVMGPLTYDPMQIDTLPTEQWAEELIDATRRTGWAVWQRHDGTWKWIQVDVRVTILRAEINWWHHNSTEPHNTKPTWWVDDIESYADKLLYS